MTTGLLPTAVKRVTVGKMTVVLLDDGRVIWADDLSDIDRTLAVLNELPEDLLRRLIRLVSNDPRPGPERFTDLEQLAKDPRLKGLEAS